MFGNFWTLISGVIFLLLAVMDASGRKRFVQARYEHHPALRAFQRRQAMLEGVIAFCGIFYSFLQGTTGERNPGLGLIALVSLLLIGLNNRAFIRRVERGD